LVQKKLPQDLRAYVRRRAAYERAPALPSSAVV